MSIRKPAITPTAMSGTSVCFNWLSRIWATVWVSNDQSRATACMRATSFSSNAAGVPGRTFTTMRREGPERAPVKDPLSTSSRFRLNR